MEGECVESEGGDAKCWGVSVWRVREGRGSVQCMESEGVEAECMECEGEEMEPACGECVEGKGVESEGEGVEADCGECVKGEGEGIDSIEAECKVCGE